MIPFYAHTHKLGNKHNKLHWQTVQSHAYGVALRAGSHAQPFCEVQRAYWLGLLHDLGKYGDPFQRRLEGEGSSLDHWSSGAIFARKHLQDAALTLCIQGHHIGLQAGDAQTLNELTVQQLVAKHPLGLRLTEPSLNVLILRLKADGFTVPPKVKQVPLMAKSAAAMLDTRMLFSALVDADYLDTEAATAMPLLNGAARPSGPDLDAPRALAALEQRLSELGQNTDLPAKTLELRRDLMTACAVAGQQTEQRHWTLTAPTGSGKTLAMLKFALTRAVQDPRIRRIVVVLPYLSILDQTVDEYRRVFKDFDAQYVLEHHSLTGTHSVSIQHSTADDGQNEQDRQVRLLTQNWDAPIVITTSVQLLESLHAAHPGTCRKLHRLAGSVLLLDEVQTLPTALAVTTLKTLSHLASDKYGSVVVMATATQPAFDTLHAAISEGEPVGSGWQPQEIAPPSLQLFERSKRVRFVWKLDDPVAWSEVQSWIRNAPKVLCIVNLKAHALELAKGLDGEVGLFHLSTSLCAAHRREVLSEIRRRLVMGEPCRVVSTQCVEAGVDLDFPLVIRALAPLDSLAQAAGRCNRHALHEYGELRVFLPQEEKYPTPAYKQAAQVALSIWRIAQGHLELDNAAVFRRFYQQLWTYQLTDAAPLRTALERQDYPEVAHLYRLISNDSVNVVVPYGKGLELAEEAAQHGITREWMRQAQPYSVAAFRSKDGTLPPYFQPINFRAHKGGQPQEVPDWFICTDTKAYSAQLGLLPDGGGADWYSL